ncbi:MAG TPA: hypothetical protein PKC25_00865 [Candidatus Rifleibacterium sp.]|nr:hypothetical protein [Candidatus Rifleibacterium sp.]
MKKIFLLLSLLFAGPVYAQAQANNITSPFKLWLLNNEARALSSLSSDEMLISKTSLPFSFMPPSASAAAKPEERLWAIHRKFYILLDEVQGTYTLARQFGNGKFSVVLKQARPEIWSVIPLMQFCPELINRLAPELRRAFHQTLLRALNLDPQRDADLTTRLNRAIKKLSDEEFRLLNDYFASFAALFPADGSIKVLRGFVEAGSKKPFGTGIKELFRPVGSQPAEAQSTTTAAAPAVLESDDPLAELERLAQFDSGEISTLAEPASDSENFEENTDGTPAPTQPTELEPPPPGTDDLFKIWD